MVDDLWVRRRKDKAVATWLLVGVGMTIIQIALGGITRLTGSGLSITEWDVITGTLPPLNQAQWADAFEKYKATPQFRLLNADFTLSNFKFIFFWEWFHRLWARLIGLVFAAGFIFFAVRKYFQPHTIKPLIILFLLGALQGAIGWIMVASGLTGDAIYVKPTRLALHFIFALGLLCYTFWFALRLLVPATEVRMVPASNRLAKWVIALLLLQLVFGALMAGHKAATAAPTWPTINGYWLAPPGLWRNDHGWLNLIDNKIMVHFVHRGLAYLLGLLTVIFSFRLTSSYGWLKTTGWAPTVAVLLQISLGIASVLSSTTIVPNEWGSFEWSAQLHQLTGMCYLLIMVWMLYLTGSGKK